MNTSSSGPSPRLTVNSSHGQLVTDVSFSISQLVTDVNSSDGQLVTMQWLSDSSRVHHIRWVSSRRSPDPSSAEEWDTAPPHSPSPRCLRRFFSALIVNPKPIRNFCLYRAYGRELGQFAACSNRKGQRRSQKVAKRRRNRWSRGRKPPAGSRDRARWGSGGEAPRSWRHNILNA